MTVLITGATGLIGRTLTQSLVDSGLNPRVVTRRPHRVLENFDSRVMAFEWHPRTEPFPASALEGVERIVHLMGEPLHAPLTRQSRDRAVASRRVATSRLVEALGRSRVHLIVASSAAVYGHAAGLPLTETTAVQPPRDKLALALLGCEEEADRLRENGSIVTLVRLGPVIAPGAFPDILFSLFERRLGWRPAHAEAAMPAIDHVDAVALLAWLVRSRPLPGPVHAVAPEPLRSADLEKLLENASPRRGRVRLPRWVLRRQIGVLADFVHSRQRVVPQRLLDAGFVFSRPDPLESMRAVLAARSEDRAGKSGAMLGAVAQGG